MANPEAGRGADILAGSSGTPLPIEDRRRVKEKIHRALSDYLDATAGIGIVDQVMLGVDREKQQAYIFNVLTADVNWSGEAEPRYTDLTHLAAVLERSLEPEVLARVSYVNPSNYRGLKENCRKRHIALLAIKLEP